MARIIISTEDQPLKLSPRDRSVWICQCGLSKNKPFCDGSHTRVLGESKHQTYYYTKTTQKRINIPGFDGEGLLTSGHRGREVIYMADSIEIIRVNTHSEEYQDVKKVREAGMSRKLNEILDDRSDVYLLKINDSACATMRVTQARDHKLDIEDFYPDVFLSTKLRSVVGSANGLCKVNNGLCHSEQIHLFVKEVWKDQYKDGMRIDLINATMPMVRYYRRLGYEEVGPTFTHPESGKESRAMFYVASRYNDCALSAQLVEFYSEHEPNKEEYLHICEVINTYV